MEVLEQGSGPSSAPQNWWIAAACMFACVCECVCVCTCVCVHVCVHV